jgi:transposase
MNAYSKDLRLKTLAAIDRGIPRKEVAELFGVSLSTIKRWLSSEGALRGTSTYTRSPADPL